MRTTPPRDLKSLESHEAARVAVATAVLRLKGEPAVVDGSRPVAAAAAAAVIPQPPPPIAPVPPPYPPCSGPKLALPVPSCPTHCSTSSSRTAAGGAGLARAADEYDPRRPPPLSMDWARRISRE